ncbi:hypothetical protein CEUSTIGMA_g11416.t1 [Chlamydomonas eustigma]|uniref:Mitochondrial carrier protein n=1 Tax=Chlamydomonas eustigma TaxID=1157962 RepID=A0A250XLL6_9CHLO|nr:hypothetical protein CEUSTIGMA_g11416.t1 [Chlamydomonas eustigma]|eukprot:GAX83991.1 hypothetical protein CEUSTIGMA_g11416.t1 [Chlamydomonas eustigma]
MTVAASEYVHTSNDTDRAHDREKNIGLRLLNNLPDPAKLMIAGGLSGVLAKTATAPLSRLTILYQVQALSRCGSSQTDVTSTSGRMNHPAWESHAQQVASSFSRRQLTLSAAVKHVIQQEGWLSLWKGNLATLLHRLPYSAVNFSTFELVDKTLTGHITSTPARRFMAGAAAGMSGCIAAYPLDLLRTRLAAQTESEYYQGINHALRRILTEEGFFGLYRGLGATLVQVTPSLAFHFMFYSTLKDALASGSHRLPSDVQLPPSSHVCKAAGQQQQHVAALSMMAAGLAGLCSSTLTFPLDKVRRMMQVQGAGNQSRRLSWLETWSLIWKRGGFWAFYDGIAAEYIKVVPGMIIAFVTFETLKQAMRVGENQPDPGNLDTRSQKGCHQASHDSLESYEAKKHQKNEESQSEDTELFAHLLMNEDIQQA